MATTRACSRHTPRPKRQQTRVTHAHLHGICRMNADTTTHATLAAYTIRVYNPGGHSHGWHCLRSQQHKSTPARLVCTITHRASRPVGRCRSSDHHHTTPAPTRCPCNEALRFTTRCFRDARTNRTCCACGARCCRGDDATAAQSGLAHSNCALETERARPCWDRTNGRAGGGNPPPYPAN